MNRGMTALYRVSKEGHKPQYYVTSQRDKAEQFANEHFAKLDKIYFTNKEWQKKQTLLIEMERW